ncbi:MAG: hypothetical protein ACOCXM_06175 [Myxococcota bacterium]
MRERLGVLWRGGRALGAFVLLLAGCQVFDESLLPPKPKEMGDAGVCGKRPPDRLELQDGPSVPPVLFALRDVELEQSGDSTGIGYDLDGYCTEGTGDQGECAPPAFVGDAAPGEPLPLPRDGVDGIDNIFGEDLYPSVDLALQISDDPAIEAIYGADGEARSFQGVAHENHLSGRGTLLVLLEDWNGTPNDPRVRMSTLQAAAGTPCVDDNGTPPPVEFDDEGNLLSSVDGTPAPPPSWDGNDCWWARNDAFVADNPQNDARILDDRAYVSDGTVVQSLPEGREILFFAGPVGSRVVLTDGLATAELRDDDSIRNVVVAGRWSIADLFDTGPHIGICEGASVEDTLANLLDEVADVRRSPGPSDLSTACNAVSIGVRFDRGVGGHLVRDGEGLAEVGPSPPLPNPCDGT